MPISAKVIASSLNKYREQTMITTFELEYPRFIHSELMTHRVFSRNGASSRAIPVEKQIEYIIGNTAMPLEWGKNKSGMQASETVDNNIQDEAISVWINARDDAIQNARKLIKLGIHKQLTNRITEPFTHMKIIVTSTEFENWFKLRDHSDAQPEIQKLAQAMKIALMNSTPKLLSNEEWHMPYYEDGYWSPSKSKHNLEDAKAISSSCCAQVSYRKLDDTLEKAKIIYDRLITSEPVHASPFEHQAHPIDQLSDWKNIIGATHIDKNNVVWSGNFRNWIQNRQIINDSYV
jgi:thymidylate synthase ThyX